MEHLTIRIVHYKNKRRLVSWNDTFLFYPTSFYYEICNEKKLPFSIKPSPKELFFFLVSFGWITPVANNAISRIVSIRLFCLFCWIFVLLGTVCHFGPRYIEFRGWKTAAALWRRGFVQARSSIDFMSRVIGDVGRLPQARRLQSNCVLLSRCNILKNKTTTAITNTYRVSLERGSNVYCVVTVLVTCKLLVAADKPIPRWGQ